MKGFWLSKTFWVNLIALIAVILQIECGFIVTVEIETAILIIINLILRAITKEELDWSFLKRNNSY